MKKWVKWIFYRESYGHFYLRDWVDTFMFFVGLTAAVAALFVVIGGVVFALDDHSCYSTASTLGLKGNYGIFSGCIVDVHGTKIPLDNYVANTVTK